MKRILCAALFVLASSMAAEQAMSLLYDPKIPPAPVSLSQGQQQKIVANTIAFLGNNLGKRCKVTANDWKNTKVNATMTGSFTKANSQQTAYLFSTPCTINSGEASDGRILSIYENGKAVQTVLLDPYFLGNILEVYTLRDINLNNQSEIAVVTDHCYGGCSHALNIIDWQSTQPRMLGSIDRGKTHLYFAEGAEIPTETFSEYTLYVAKAKKPIFVGLEAGSKTVLTLLSLEESSIGVTVIR